MRFVWETPEEINMALARRQGRTRKCRNLSQQALVEKRNVSFGSFRSGFFWSVGRVCG